MTDPLERVLQLVAEGKLSADDAAPILTALDRKSRPDASTAARGALSTPRSVGLQILLAYPLTGGW